MNILVVTPPQPIVTWEQAKAHLREEGDDEKVYVEGLVAAASAWIDGPAGWLGRSLGPQLLQLDGVFSCERMGLPFGPVLEVDSVSTGVFSNAPFTVSADEFVLRDGHLVVAAGAAWVGEPDHRVRYWAGYGKRDPQDATKWVADVPAPVKQAILLLVGQWFGNRSAVRIGDAVNQMPFAVEALLAPYRVWR